MENFLYFAEAVVETGGDKSPEATMVPASSFMYCEPDSTTQTSFYFKSILGSDEGRQRIALTHGTNNNKTVMKNFMEIINQNPGDGFVVVADAETGTAVNKSPNFNSLFAGDVTAVAIFERATGYTDIAISGTTYGAGAISTGTVVTAPQIRRWRSHGVIVTQLRVDLSGLGGKGASADDAIGLPAGGAAYIYRNVVSQNGIIFKYEVSCVELPAAASGSATTDIDFAWNSSAAIEIDGACGTSELNTAALVAGETAVVTVPALTANDYLYMTEADTAATDGVYNAGQFLITFYGMPVDFS